MPPSKRFSLVYLRVRRISALKVYEARVKALGCAVTLRSLNQSYVRAQRRRVIEAEQAFQIVCVLIAIGQVTAGMSGAGITNQPSR